MDLQFKSIKTKIEIKQEPAGDGVLKIRFYALAFGNLDSTGDIIMPGACDKWLKSEMAERMALCYQHEFDKVIGRITDKGVDEKGLWVEAEVLPTSIGKDVQILLQGGAIKEFSIGYYANEWHYSKSEDYNGDEVRYLDAITIYEVSPVTLAANPRAQIQSIGKGIDPNKDIAFEKMSDAELEKLKTKVDEEYAKRIINKF